MSDSQRKAQRKRYNKLQKWFTNYKKCCRCSVCGIRNHVVLDFHHYSSTKNDGLGKLISAKASIRKIIHELHLTIPVCANCHRILHAKKKESVLLANQS